MSTILLRRRRLGATSCRGISEKSTTGISVSRSFRLDRDKVPESGDTVIRWGCTATVDSNNVINTARAIHQVNDKVGFRLLLQAANMELAPRTWIDEDDIQYPCIVRPASHSRGRDVHLCHTTLELMSAIETCGAGWYASEYIEKVAEYRVFVVQGRAVAVAEKTPANRDDVAWNVAQGGRFDNVSWDNWPLQAVRKSIEAFNLSELDFGGVDVMVDAAGKAYVIEINSAPSLTSEYRQECMAKAFDWIVVHGKERIPLIEERGGYRKFIHPAICDRAIVPSLGAPAAVLEGANRVHSVEPVTHRDEYSDEEMVEQGFTSPPDILLAGLTDQQLLDEMDRRMGG